MGLTLDSGRGRCEARLRRGRVPSASLCSGPRERRLPSSPQFPQVSLASRSRILSGHLTHSRLRLLGRLTSAQIPLQTFPPARAPSLIVVRGVMVPAFCRWGASFLPGARNHRGDNFVLGRSRPKAVLGVCSRSLASLSSSSLLKCSLPSEPHPRGIHLNITHLGEPEFSVSVKPSVVISRHPGGMRYQTPASPFHLHCPEVCLLHSWGLCTPWHKPTSAYQPAL